MIVRKCTHILSPIAMAILVASCGGSGSNSSNNSSTPELGAASGETEPDTGSESTDIESETNGSIQGTPVTGRVADGYIQGATVCIDLNGNDACDAGEPDAVTGEGGIYELTVPEGAEDSSIVAAIPAEAIDEDTGEAIGQALVFIAPADQPQFVSPITTLVHQELQSNPNLDIEEAEDAVKALLGVENEDISLFSDYVASGEQSENDSDQSDTYRFIHDTARVVTSLMKEIETQVGDAAGENGTDVVGDVGAQSAIRDIVRSEVSELLPEIARQVAASETQESELDTDAEQENTFDPASIASGLVPSDITDNVSERITAVIERVDLVISDIQTVLTDGLYWIEFDCEYGDYVDQSITFEQTPDQITTDIASDDSGVLPANEHCVPSYGRVQLDSTGSQLVSQEFRFDINSGTWLEENNTDEDFYEYVLVDGEWQALTDEGPQGTVVFDEEGTAILSNTGGTLQLKAATQNVETLTVESHLLAGDADPFWFGLLTESDLFPSEAQSHIISVNEAVNPYVLFNVKLEDADADLACADFADNCNVIGSTSFESLSPLTRLDDIRESATQGIELAQMFSGLGASGNMSFVINGELNDEGEELGALPASGSVEWPSLSVGITDTDTGITSPTDQVDIGTCYAPGEFPVDTGTASVSEEEALAQAEDLNQLEEQLLQTQQLVEEQQLALEEAQIQVEAAISQGPDLSPEELESLELWLIGLEEELALVQQQSQEEQAALLELEQQLYPTEQQRDAIEAELTLIEEELSPEEPGLEDIDLAQLPDNEELPFPETDVCADLTPESSVGETLAGNVKSVVNDGTQNVSTRWKLVEADGVTMIEVQLPEMLLYGDEDEAQSILLIEHEGFVRQGARLSDSYVSTVVTYNESAFTTMQAIAERLSNDL